MSVDFPNDDGKTNKVVLDKISLQIKSKEIIALVGESGSGKTILSRAIMNLIPAPGRLTSGKVYYHERNLLELNNEELSKLRGNRITTIVSNPKGELTRLKRSASNNVIMHHLGLTREEAKKGYKVIEDVKIPDPQRRFDAYPHELLVWFNA